MPFFPQKLTPQLREIAAWAGMVLALFAIPGFSAEPPAPRTYLETVFTTEDGLNSSVVNAIKQTQNGLLWVATFYDLVRFDGHRFSVAHSGETTALAEGPDGDLWMATLAGVLRIPKSALDQWGPLPTTAYHLGKDTADIVDCLLAARDGTIWATTRKGIYKFNGREFKLVVPDVWANRLEETANGHLLIIGSARFMEWDGSRILEHPEILPLLAVTVDHIFHVVDDRQGGRWYATMNGLVRIQNGSVKRWVAEGSTAKIPVFRIYEDRAGERYVAAGEGTVNGVYRVGESSLEPVKIGKGGRALYSDSIGDLWIGTNGSGLMREKQRGVYVYSMDDGLPSNIVTTVLAAHDGKLWVGTRCGGISWFDGERFHAFGGRAGLTNSCVNSLAEDAHHDLWVGTPNGVFRFSNGRFTLEWRQQGLQIAQVWKIVPATDNSLWFSTESGLVHLKNGKSRTYTTADGLSSDHVMNVYLSRNGEIWAGTAIGIDHLEGDRFVPVSPQGRGEGRVLGEDPLGGLYATSALELGHIENRHFVGFSQSTIARGMVSVNRDLWFTGNRIFRLPLSTLSLADKFPAEPLDYLALGSSDGLATSRDGHDQPQIAATPDGKVWFALFQGLTMIEPSRFSGAPKAAVGMGEIIVDRNSHAPGQELHLPKGQHHVELHFEVFEISSPERTRLQYRLDDVDSTWFDAGPGHSAIYESIPVGIHAFHVRASNRDGVWDRDGIVYKIIQEPFLYQTRSFRIVCALGGFLLIAGIYRLHLRQVSAKVRARMEGRLAERERIARELHDTLLQGFHSVILRFAFAASRISPDEPAHNMLQSALDRATEVMVEGRNRVRNLRSSVAKDATLPETLAHAGLEIAEGSAIRISVNVDGRSRDLQSIVFDEVYWIGHEAMVNSVQHARASLINIEVAYGSGEFRASFSDDGRGIEPEVLKAGVRPGHWGLVGMRERAEKIGGRLTISCRPGEGTEVKVCVPASKAYQPSGRVSRWLWRLLHLANPAAN